MQSNPFRKTPITVFKFYKENDKEPLNKLSSN